MGFTSDACWFLLLKTLLIKNNKKREAALKNEAGGDEKHVCFFAWPKVPGLLGLEKLLQFDLHVTACSLFCKTTTQTQTFDPCAVFLDDDAPLVSKDVFT